MPPPRVSTLGALALLASLAGCQDPPAVSRSGVTASTSEADAAAVQPSADAQPSASVEPLPPSSPKASSDPPVPSAAPAEASSQAYSILDASRLYDFRLEARPQPRKGNVNLGPPGTLTILRKGTSEVVQQLPIAALSKRVSAPGYAPSVLVDDLDFDGHEDLALHTGDSAPNGGATYSVYLFAPALRLFVHSPALSHLTEITGAPLRVDAAGKRLFIAYERGCCTHVKEQYAVRQRLPLLMMRETDEKNSEGRCLTFEVRGEDLVMRPPTVHCTSVLAPLPFE